MKKQIALLRDQEVPRKNSVGHADSVEKIISQLSLLTPDAVTYQGHSATGRLRKEVVLDTPVHEILLSPSLFRKFICTDSCTACCQKFTLDYIPSELRHVENQEGFKRRYVWINRKRKWVWSNDQNDNPICDFLRVQRPGGGLGCANYKHAPLSCISAPQLQFIQMRPGKTYILKKPFGRAWAMTPTPQCQFVEFETQEEFRAEIDMMVGILCRFEAWAKYFGVRTHLKEIIHAVRYEPFDLQGATPIWTSA